jgi:hypothetical protein
MATGLIGEAPTKGTKASPGLNSSAAQPGVAYDGNNAQVQQQPSAQSMVAIAGAKRGANWFYWIAALSVINTIVALSGGQFHFVLGLGVTEITDAIRTPQVRMIGYFIDVLVLGFFLMCGYFAGKLQKWAFIMGMSFYLLDAGIMLLAQDWLGFAFHIYALICIWKGFSFLKTARQASQVSVLSGS